MFYIELMCFVGLLINLHYAYFSIIIEYTVHNLTHYLFLGSKLSLFLLHH